MLVVVRRGVVAAGPHSLAAIGLRLKRCVRSHLDGTDMSQHEVSTRESMNGNERLRSRSGGCELLGWWWKDGCVGSPPYFIYTHHELTPITAPVLLFFVFFFLFCRIVMYVDCSCGEFHTQRREKSSRMISWLGIGKRLAQRKLSRLRCASVRRCTDAQRIQRTDGVH